MCEQGEQAEQPSCDCPGCEYPIGEDPERARQEYLRSILARVEEHGWCVQGVLGTDSRPHWAYTVGLTVHGLPELVVTGLPPGHASAVLNDMAEDALAALESAEGPPRAGEVYTVRGRPAVEIVALTEPSAHLLVAVALYGDGIRALQLVYADEAGHFPWSSSYRDGHGGQPVLGTRGDG